MTTTQSSRLLARTAVARARELTARGLSSAQITRMVRDGRLVRVGRGQYALPGVSMGEHVSLVTASRQVSRGVVCLLSALRFHGLTSQSPHEVWMAIGQKDWQPVGAGTKMRIVRFSGASLTSGIEKHKLDGVTVRVYTPAKTVADCFKFRNKIGLDVAIEALRDCLRQRRATVDDLWRYAKICRVSNVMRPYLEALS